MDIFGPSDSKEALAAGSSVGSAAEGILCFELTGCNSATILKRIGEEYEYKV